MTRSSAFADMRTLSAPTLVAICVGTLVVVLDGLAGPAMSLIGLLAIPPVIAARSASPPETGLVGAFCVVLAFLSGLWHGDFLTTDHLAAILVVISGSAAGIWTAILRERLERGRSADAMLARLTALLEDELDQERRAGHVTRIAVPTVADAATLDLLLPDGSIRRVATEAVDRDLAVAVQRLRRRHPIDPDSPHPVARVLRDGRERLFTELSDDELDELARTKPELNAMHRWRAAETLVVPLRARGSVLGALTLSLTEPGRHYDDEARRVVRGVAERAALAIDNARVHQEQAHIASVLQRSLMPDSIPEIAGFESAVRFVAAGEANQVGGDFFDVFRSGRDSWTVVIGDVCGKGPEAAALTALARHTIRASESVRSSPSAVLGRLHDSIREFDSQRRFCTAVLARVERGGSGRSRLRLTIGGHPSPLAVRADGAIEPVGRPGTLIGGLDQPRLADATTDVDPGESIVLYTDGLLEVRDRTRRGEPSWPAPVLRGATGKSAEGIAELLLEAALDRQGGEPRDDIAVVVLQRTS